MTTKLCIRCLKEPAYVGPQKADSYCRDCRKEYMREWAAQNRERINTRQRIRYNGPHNKRERELRRKYRETSKREAINAYGGSCACCGEHHIEFLAIHHINGKGKEHRTQASAVGHQFYRWLQRQGWPQDPPLGVLCHNCNMSHGFYGYCPHEREQTKLVNSDEI